MYRAFEKARDEHLSHFTNQILASFHRRSEYRSVERTLISLRDTASSKEEKDCADSALEATIEARKAAK